MRARAYDAAGNSTLSAAVNVNVANTSSFQNEILVQGGLNLPTAMKFLPDGRLLVSELQGRIRVLSPPYTSVSSTSFLQITNIGVAGVQQGIYDFVLDPNFNVNHYYYVFYTLGTPNHDRVSRFTANALANGTVAGSELVLYEDTLDAHAEHHGGALNFGNDGKLYFTTGEHFDPPVVAGPAQSAGQDPSDQPGRDGADGQPVLRRYRAELRLGLGARVAQSVPGVLRRAHGSADHRRRGRQRRLDGDRGGQRRRSGSQLRLAQRRGSVHRAVHGARSTRTRTTGATRP